MITLYRRHRKSCPYRIKGRAYRRCQCPIWADGSLAGQDIRESLRLKNWQKAHEVIQEWQAKSRRTKSSGPIPLQEACGQFLQDAKS